MHTFVIPVYKESPYLEACIQSLINQTVKSTIILTTSTPTVFSAEIAKKFKLPYFINDKPGIAADWNFALFKAEKLLATIAHQDDIYEPAYTENMIKAMSKHQSNKVLIAFTDYQDLMHNKAKPYTLNWFVKKALLFPFVFNGSVSSVYLKKLVLLFGDPICCPSVTFNLRALKGFQFSDDLTCVLDWYAWYQLAERKGTFCFVNKKLIKHRIHPESETTVQLLNGIRRDEELQMFKMMWGERFAGFISRLYTRGHADNITA